MLRDFKLRELVLYFQLLIRLQKQGTIKEKYGGSRLKTQPSVSYVPFPEPQTFRTQRTLPVSSSSQPCNLRANRFRTYGDETGEKHIFTRAERQQLGTSNFIQQERLHRLEN